MDYIILAFALHMFVVADLPPEYGVMVYRAAEDEQIDPYDLAAVLITEKSGSDFDFSLEAAIDRETTWRWEVDVEGAGGERGLFQLKPRHARKAQFQPEDLWEAWPNIRTAAAVVRHNQERHADCEARAYNWHLWIAHYKCGPRSRDILEGRCFWAQRKYLKVRASLGSFFSPDFKAIDKRHRRWVEVEVEKARRLSGS